jgi:hypothetical protein
LETRIITMPKSFADSIREVQVFLMSEYGRDVSFTEAANYILMDGLSVWASKETTMSEEEVDKCCRQWMADMATTAIPGFRDSIAEQEKAYEANLSQTLV